MRASIRIAILECDEPIGETKRRYGGFGNIFSELLQAGAERFLDDGIVGPPRLVISKYDVVHAMLYPDLDNIDAILLTGSRYDSFTDGENGWIAKLADFVSDIIKTEHRVRVIGVCFGHQLIARSLGTMPMRSVDGWEIAVTPVKLTETGKEIFQMDELAVHQMHRDYVPSIPPGTVLLGRSHGCSVQSMYIRNKLLSLQGHPEYSGRISEELLDRRHGTLLDDDTYYDGKRRAYDPHDGIAIAAAFIRFILAD